MESFISIDGVDITPYLEHEGFAWQRADLDSDETKRLMDGDLERHYVATKYYINITCKPLLTPQASIVLKAIKPQKIQVRYLDPEVGDYVNRTMYANNIPAQVAWHNPEDGKTYWKGIAFQLTEY